jgi:hypothetical protein
MTREDFIAEVESILRSQWIDRDREKQLTSEDVRDVIDQIKDTVGPLADQVTVRPAGWS